MNAKRDQLLRTARRLLTSRVEAEDAVQDAYFRALSSETNYQEQLPWMHAVVRNVAIDRLRRMQLEAKHSRAQLPPDGPSECALEIRSDCEAALRHLLKHVSPAEAAVILLSDVFEFDHTEIARIIGKSEAASRQFLHRARSRKRDSGSQANVEEFHVALCWRAIEARDPAFLMGMLRTVTAGTQRTSYAVGQYAPPQSSSVLVHVNGRYAIALVLDGVVLCVVPLGDQATAMLEPA